jgi:hypothetical protein
MTPSVDTGDTGTAGPLADRLAITETVSALGLLADQRAWHELQALFADPVEVDYTSLNGGEPVTVAPADLIAGWRQNLEHLDATQHLIANHQVTIHGENATCVANVQATHILANHSGGPIWTVGGRYDIGLRHGPGGWQISGLTLTLQWATGNQHVMTIAAARTDAT